MAKTKDNHVIDATRYLLESIETSMFEIPKEVLAHMALKNLLGKLGIKSAKVSGKLLQWESLSAVLKQVTFDDTHIKQWKTDGGK